MVRHAATVVSAAQIFGGAGVGVWGLSATTLTAGKTIIGLSVSYDIAGATNVYGARFSVGIYNGGVISLGQFICPQIVYNIGGVLTIAQPAWTFPYRDLTMGGIAGGVLIPAGVINVAGRMDNAAANAAALDVFVDLLIQD